MSVQTRQQKRQNEIDLMQSEYLVSKDSIKKSIRLKSIRLST